MTSTHDLATRLIDIETLRPHPHNPRNGDVDAIADSLLTNGQYRPIVVARGGVILAGNHTYAAACQLGWTQLHVVQLDLDPDSAEALRIMAADNRTAELGGYDEGLLTQLLAGLAELDDGLTGTGYSDRDLARLLADTNTDNPWDTREFSPNPEPDRVQNGDLWALGPHRLRCGDATIPASFEGFSPASVLFTDPPYGIGYTGGAALERATIAADATAETAIAAIGAMLDNAQLEAGTLSYVFHSADANGLRVAHYLWERGLYRWGLAWVKDTAPMARGDYHGRYESIAYGWQPGAAHAPVVDRTSTTVFEVPRPTESDRHPTMKPPALIQQILRGHDLPPNTVVLDPFAGSGSVLVACDRLGLVAQLIELEPGYCDGIITAWEAAHPDSPASKLEQGQ